MVQKKRRDGAEAWPYAAHAAHAAHVGPAGPAGYAPPSTRVGAEENEWVLGWHFQSCSSAKMSTLPAKIVT